MKQLVIGLLVLCSLFSCKKKDDNTNSTNTLLFNGISCTDVFAVPVCTPDSTDWNYNDTWSTRENNLFSSVFSNLCTPPYTYTIQAYPNPCTNQFNVQLNLDSSSVLQFRLVDKNFNVLLQGDSVKGNMLSIAIGSFNYHDTARFYYKLIRGNCEWRGHGDVLFQ